MRFHRDDNHDFSLAGFLVMLVAGAALGGAVAMRLGFDDWYDIKTFIVIVSIGAPFLFGFALSPDETLLRKPLERPLFFIGAVFFTSLAVLAIIAPEFLER